MVKTLDGCKKWLDKQIDIFGIKHTKEKEVNEMFFKIMFIDCYLDKKEVLELKKYIKSKKLP